MANVFFLLIMSVTAAIILASLIVASYRYASYARDVRRLVSDNIEFCLFLFWFMDEKNHSVSLSGLSKTDLKNIGEMDVIHNLTEYGVIRLSDEKLTLVRVAWSCLEKYAENRNDARKGEKEFGEELLHSLMLPHITDKYASVNFDAL